MRTCIVIVLLNWNGRDDTLACLKSLRPVLAPDRKVLVVDNGSTDGSVAAIRSAYPDAELIETGCNLGYAGGNNVGIERAVASGADFVLVLNNDTLCAPDVIDRLLEEASRNPRVGAFCPRIFYLHEPERVWFDGARWSGGQLLFRFPGKDRLESELPFEVHETDYACGAALFMRADLIREIGAFDARYFLVWEEADWCFRARSSGWSSLVVPAAKVWHKVGASFGSEASPLRTYFSLRNKLVWLSAHGSPGERSRALAQAAWSSLPRFAIPPQSAGPLPKRLVWAWRDWAKSAVGRGERLEYLVKRRAFLDFAFGLLGPAPPVVLDLNRRWAARNALVATSGVS